MIDKVNRVFAVLARQSYGVYIILGMVISFLFVYFVERESQIPALKNLMYPGFFIILAHGFLLRGFYGKHERRSKKVPLIRGQVVRDEYFLEKITSNISNNKKILGYLYVIFRIACTGIQGFVLGLALVMWLTKGH